MEHGVDTTVIAVIAGCVVLWGLVSARLQRWNITAPMAFVAMGYAVSHEPLAFIDVGLRSSSVREIAEVTLALVLFTDASGVDLKALRADTGVPARLLGIGLPLTIAAGAAAAVLVTDGNWWLAAVVGASVAPTDAALGASIMHDDRVPTRVRRDLNIESGLNDGIVTPLVAFFIAGAAATEAAQADGVSAAVVDIAVGIALGVLAGAVGAVLLRAARRRGWSAPAFVPLFVLGLAVLTYTLAVGVGANGFVAAFVGGMAFGGVMGRDDEPALEFTDDAGELLSLLVWFLFGATMLGVAFEHLEPTDVVFAVLALTVLRMVPVALALAGSGLDRSTLAFVGWFGPRGLASVVFALIAVDSLEPRDGDRVLAVVALTVLCSVVAHGVTAAPFAARYGRRTASLDPQQPEHLPAEAPTPPRSRRGSWLTPRP